MNHYWSAENKTNQLKKTKAMEHLKEKSQKCLLVIVDVENWRGGEETESDIEVTCIDKSLRGRAGRQVE